MRITSQTIYDVGMHRGEDSAFYLSKGFNVVAIEANPKLVEFGHERFREEIQDNRVKIVHGAIINPQVTSGSADHILFYENAESVFGTIDGDWAKRNEEQGFSCRAIEVSVCDFRECLAQNDAPYYIKIDIEGADIHCLRQLAQTDVRPNFISIESEKVSLRKLIEELNLLKSMGYHRFKAIQQDNISRQRQPQPPKEGIWSPLAIQDGSSGLFGEETPGRWLPFTCIVIKYLFIFAGYKLWGEKGIIRQSLFGRATKRLLRQLFGIFVPGWYDTHAKLTR